MRSKNFNWLRVTTWCVAATLGALPVVAQAAPCSGRAQLKMRWSKAAATALVTFSTTLCDQPPGCAEPSARAAGTLFTKSPISVTIKDAQGHSLSGIVDAGAASCAGRCERSNRGGCLGGADTHRLASSFVRYVVSSHGKTSVVANKLKIPATEEPALVTPITVTVTDANGYTVAADLRKCRTRRSAKGAAFACSS